MGRCGLGVSCPLCLPGAAGGLTDFQNSHVETWTGAEKQTKSSESPSASVPGKQVLSSTNATLPFAGGSQTVSSPTMSMVMKADQITFHLYSHPEKPSELWRASFRVLGLYQRHKCPLTPPNSSRVSQEAQTQDGAGQFTGLHCWINSDKL